MAWHLVNGYLLSWFSKNFQYLESMKRKLIQGKKIHLRSGKLTVNFTSSRARAARLCVHLELLPLPAEQQQLPLLTQSSVCLWLPWIPARAGEQQLRLCAPHGWIQPFLAHSFILAVQWDLQDVTVPGTYLPFKCVWNWQMCSKVIKGGMTDSLTKYPISLGNQAK